MVQSCIRIFYTICYSNGCASLKWSINVSLLRRGYGRRFIHPIFLFMVILTILLNILSTQPPMNPNLFLSISNGPVF